jgi:hypothetical protein
MNDNRLFVQSKHKRFLLSLLLEEKEKIGAIFLDANLIQVAPECRDTDGLPCMYHGTFGQNMYS